VHHVPDAVVYTDTPDTFATWVRQQVRWSRGTMVETIWYPRMIYRLSPWHIFTILKSRLIPVIIFFTVVSAAVTGRRLLGGILDNILTDVVISADLFCCVALQVAYLVFLGPNDTLVQDVVWLVPALVWFLVLSPGIVMWSLITVLDGSWGTQPRAVARKVIDPCSRTSILHASNEVLFVLAWLVLCLVTLLRDYYHKIIMV
jgi:hyaluronan synthase